MFDDAADQVFLAEFGTDPEFDAGLGIHEKAAGRTDRQGPIFDELLRGHDSFLFAITKNEGWLYVF